MSRSLQFDIVANDEATAKMKGVQNAARGFAAQLGKYFAAFTSAQAIASRALMAIQHSFNWGAGLKDSAAAVGLTVEEFQRLEYAAGQTGVSVEKLQTGMRELRKTMRDASQGNAESARILLAMGYSQEQIATNSIDAMDAFMRVSEAISAARSEQEKFNIASAVFGDRVAQQMVAALGNFGELKRVISETPLISNEDAAALDKLDDLITRAQQTGKVGIAKLLTDPFKTLGALFPGSFIAGQAFSAAAAAEAAKPKPVVAPTDEAKARAQALIEAGRKVGKGSSDMAGGGSSGLLTAAAIGGAAGFQPGASRSPVLSTLEQIEQNTRPTPDVPVNGSTNFSESSAQRREFEGAVARIKFPLKQGRQSARPSR